ncbi:MAG: hypothetical protein H8E47_05305 [Anaerolineales bacterium]|nr:hypothetical protein [Anaerolineales bacterium]
MATAVILAGIGQSARALVEQAKERQAAEGRPMAYYALSVPEGVEAERPTSLLPTVEDERLKPVDGTTKGAPAIDGESDAIYTAYVLSDRVRANHLRLTAKTLFAPDRAETTRDLEVYLLVDMADPTSVVAHHFLDSILNLREHLAGQNVWVRVCLLASSEDSPYAYFVLQQVAARLGDPLLRGIYLLEKTEESGERWQAVAEWLCLVLSGRHSPPDSAEGVGSFGLARLIVPKQEIEDFLAHRLASALLRRLQTLPSPQERREEAPEPFLRPLLEPTEPSRAVSGELAPPIAEQQEYCQLYRLGESPNLYGAFPVLSEIEARIQGQKTSSVLTLKEKLQAQVETVRSERSQAIDRRRWQVLLMEGIEGLSLRAQGWSAKLADLAQQAGDRVKTIKALLEQGGARAEEESVWLTLERMAVTLAVLGLPSVILFAFGLIFVLRGMVELLPLLIVALSPFLAPFLLQGLAYGAVILTTLLPYLGLRVRGRAEGDWQRPAFEPMRGLGAAFATGLWIVLIGLGIWRWGLLTPFQEVLGIVIALWLIAISVEVLAFLWPTVRFYELFPVWPPRETSPSYREAESKVRRALGSRSLGLAISRAAILLITGGGITLVIGQRFEGNGWELLNRMFFQGFGDAVLPIWLRDGLLLLAILCLKYVFDIVVAEYFLMTRGLSWPPRPSFWWGYLAWWLLATPGLAVAFIGYRAPAGGVGAVTYRWVIALVAAWAVARFLWERWNDESRVRQLVLDWVEWYERIAYMSFQQKAWVAAQHVYEFLQAEIRDLQGWLGDLGTMLVEMQERIGEQAEVIRAEIIRRQREGIPRYLDVGTDMDSLYSGLNMEALFDTRVDRWRAASEQLARDKDSEPLIGVLSPMVADEMEERFWRERTALDFLTTAGHPDRDSLARERAQFFNTWPSPFWTLRPVVDARYPKEIFVGLPGFRRRDIALEHAIALLTPLPEERGLPTFLEEDRWGVSAIFYQLNVLSTRDASAPAPPLRSLEGWQQEYRNRQREYKAKKRQQISSVEK